MRRAFNRPPAGRRESRRESRATAAPVGDAGAAPGVGSTPEARAARLSLAPATPARGSLAPSAICSPELRSRAGSLPASLVSSLPQPKPSSEGSTRAKLIKQKQHEQTRLRRVLDEEADLVSRHVAEDMKLHRERQRKKTEWRQQKLLEARKVAQLRAAQDEVDLQGWMEIKQIRVLDRAEDDGRRLVTAAHEAWTRSTHKRRAMIRLYHAEEQIYDELRDLEEAESAAAVRMAGYEEVTSTVRMLPLKARGAKWHIHRPPHEALCAAYCRRLEENLMHVYYARLQRWRQRCLLRRRHRREAVSLLGDTEKIMRRRFMRKLSSFARLQVTGRERRKWEAEEAVRLEEQRRRDWAAKLDSERNLYEEREYSARDAIALAEGTERNTLRVYEESVREEQRAAALRVQQAKRKRVETAMRATREHAARCDKQLRRRYREKWREWTSHRKLRRRQIRQCLRMEEQYNLGVYRVFNRRWVQRWRRARQLREQLHKTQQIGAAAMAAQQRESLRRLQVFRRRRKRLAASQIRARALAHEIIGSVKRRYWTKLHSRGVERWIVSKGAQLRAVLIEQQLVQETEHEQRCGHSGTEAAERVRLVHIAESAAGRLKAASRRAGYDDAVSTLQEMTQTGLMRYFYTQLRRGRRFLRARRIARELAPQSTARHGRLRLRTLRAFARKCIRARRQGGVSAELGHLTIQRLTQRYWSSLFRLAQVRGRASISRRARVRRLAEELQVGSERMLGGRLFRRWGRWADQRLAAKACAAKRQLLMGESDKREKKAAAAVRVRYFERLGHFAERRRRARKLERRSVHAFRKFYFARLDRWRQLRPARQSRHAVRRYKGQLLERRNRLPVLRSFWAKLWRLRQLGWEVVSASPTKKPQQIPRAPP
eukprot:TRINITY_DN1352_c6_g1_i1.p1 TRINITY_DN1352_c6_g1~~TRINITY_DN1352_c6_g1_i1.p1  ORF type:complete len:885 (+),score=313.93 TRINITY_DN1352_c6_g1_i1:88-2742(+)